MPAHFWTILAMVAFGVIMAVISFYVRHVDQKVADVKQGVTDTKAELRTELDKQRGDLREDIRRAEISAAASMSAMNLFQISVARDYVSKEDLDKHSSRVETAINRVYAAVEKVDTKVDALTKETKS